MQGQFGTSNLTLVFRPNESTNQHPHAETRRAQEEKVSMTVTYHVTSPHSDVSQPLDAVRRREGGGEGRASPEDRQREGEREGGEGGGEGGEGGGSEVTVEQGLHLRRTVGLLGATSFTIGSMIGSGIFITPTSVLRHTQSVALNLIVWILGGVLSLFGSFVVSELACRVPRNGSTYTYLKEGYGSGLAFVYLWTSVIVLGPTSLAVMALTFSRYFMTMMHMCGQPQLLVSITAVTLIVSLCVMNVTSNVLTVRANVVFLFAKVLALIIIIVGGLVVIIRGGHPDSELTSGFAGTSQSPADIAKSFYFVMWSYGGWDGANEIVEEVKNPSRNVPLAAILGVLVVTVIYVMTNVSYLAAMSTQHMLAADTVAVTWGNAVLGVGAASIIIPFCVMCSNAGSSNSNVFSFPRKIFAAARDGNFPEMFCYLHVNNRIPLLSVALLVALSIVYASASDLLELISISGFISWFFNFLTTLALLILRRRQPKDMPVAFKNPLPCILVFLLFSLALVILPLMDGVTFTFYFTLTFYGLGLLVYIVFVRLLRTRMTCCDGLMTYLQLFLRVGPPAPFTDQHDVSSDVSSYK